MSTARGFTIVAVLLAVLVLAAGCGASTEVRLDANDNGRQIKVKKGQVLVVILESNPTTGYLWEVVECEQRILQQVGEAEFEPESDKIGAPGVATLRFKALNTGSTALRLIHHRPWEKDVDPLATFSLRVVVS